MEGHEAPNGMASFGGGKRLTLIIACFVIALGAAGVVLFFVLQRPAKDAPLPAWLTQQASFAVYYPKTLPAGFRLNAQSASLLENGVISFSLDSTASGGHIVITEQARPPAMEELTKTKQFKTAVGDAYVADLNGRTAGFILTDKTLIILNAQPPVTDAQLTSAMTGMAPL